MSVKTFVAQRLLPLLARLDLLEAGSSAANAALFLATSTTSNAIGTGTKTFTTQSGKAFVAGQFVQVSDQANPANYMLGQVSSYSGTSLVVEVSSVGGSGTKTAWNIALSGPGGATGGISGGTLTGDLGDAPEVTVASAATTNIGAANSNKVVVTGNVTITAFDSVANRRKLLRFTGAPLLTHGANLILPGAANMQMAAGDMAEFTSDGSGVWRMREYQSASEANFGRSLLNTISAAAARLLLGALGLAGEEASEVDVASASTTDIGAAGSNKVRITGTTTITSLGTGANLRKRVRFAAALTLTHNATSLILPDGLNITTVAGDIAVFESDASGNWRLVRYRPADGWLEVVRRGRLAFPVAQIASTDANTLDDYEEGDFTSAMVLTTSGAAPVGVTYSSDHKAVYLKVGRFVLFHGRVSLTSKGTGGTGDVGFAGLPFPVQSTLAAVAVSRSSGHTLNTGNHLGLSVGSSVFLIEQLGAGSQGPVAWSSIADNFTFAFFGGCYTSA